MTNRTELCQQNQSRRYRCIVIQLARQGDILQSLMALRAAKQLYPQVEITLVARERFAEPAKRVPWIHEVITLPTSELLGPILSGEKSEKQGLKETAQWLKPMVQAPWDFVVNWSYSEASSFLAGLLPARVKVGYSRHRDTSFACVDGWSQYIQAVVQGQINQNIHLTDILTTQLLTVFQTHLGQPKEDNEVPVTSKSFFNVQPRQDLTHPLLPSDESKKQPRQFSDLTTKWIAFQIGSHTASKTWAPARWAKLAAYIINRHPECRIVLLGNKGEERRELEFQSALQRETGPVNEFGAVTSLIGRIAFDEWATVIGRCQWLISVDNSAIQLAALLGTRVLNISVGGSKWMETGPYGNGHYIVASALECTACTHPAETPMHDCRDHVSPEAVYAAWAYGSSEWAHRRQISIENHFSQLGWSQELASVRVNRSRIRNSNDGGGVVYEALIQRSVRPDDWMAQLIGHVARAWYCGWVPPVGQELTRETIGPNLIKFLRPLDEATQILSGLCEDAMKTSEALQKKSAKLRSQKLMDIRDRAELNNLGRKLTEIDAFMQKITDSTPALQAFTRMSKVLMHNLGGQNLADLGKESVESYKQINQGLGILRNWIKHTLDLARPVAIRPAPVISLNPVDRSPSP